MIRNTKRASDGVDSHPFAPASVEKHCVRNGHSISNVQGHLKDGAKSCSFGDSFDRPGSSEAF
jgi:hypothetical protein